MSTGAKIMNCQINILWCAVRLLFYLNSSFANKMSKTISIEGGKLIVNGADIIYHVVETKQSTTYYKGMSTIKHRIGGPAYIGVAHNSNTREEIYFVDDVAHREDGPAAEAFFLNGTKSVERWFLSGKLHRKCGAAVTAWDVNGNIIRTRYYINNVQHCETGPAAIEYYDTGAVAMETWFIDDKLHRVGKPAIVLYNRNGDVIDEQFWENGEHVDPPPKNINNVVDQAQKIDSNLLIEERLTLVEANIAKIINKLNLL